MKPMATGALLMAIAGCASAPPAQAGEVPVRGGTGHKCDAAKAQALVGRAKSRKAGAEALRLSGAATLRWIPKDGMVTMDYREDRVNLHLDGRARVVKVRCG